MKVNFTQLLKLKTIFMVVFLKLYPNFSRTLRDPLYLFFQNSQNPHHRAKPRFFGHCEFAIIELPDQVNFPANGSQVHQVSYHDDVRHISSIRCIDRDHRNHLCRQVVFPGRVLLNPGIRLMRLVASQAIDQGLVPTRDGVACTRVPNAKQLSGWSCMHKVITAYFVGFQSGYMASIISRSSVFS